ncbi:MAG: putative enoyl-CoA hydratase 1 [Marmoricola sp.]|nr:putative enoyl-CoA hydratase 1 [Marmoricola sp.]
MRVFTTLDEVLGAANSRLGTSDWLDITQERIDTFANATDDWQWIHTNPSRAATGPYGATIAHGYLTLSLLPTLAATLYRFDTPGARINYGTDRVRFPAPVVVGARIRSHVELGDVQPTPSGLQLSINTSVEIEGVGKPGCIATTLLQLHI